MTSKQWLSIVMVVLGVLTASTAQLTDLFGESKSPGVAPTSYEVNALGIPGPGGSNLLIDWPYDKTKINLSGSPYSEQPQ